MKDDDLLELFFVSKSCAIQPVIVDNLIRCSKLDGWAKFSEKIRRDPEKPRFFGSAQGHL